MHYLNSIHESTYISAHINSEDIHIIKQTNVWKVNIRKDQ